MATDYSSAAGSLHAQVKGASQLVRTLRKAGYDLDKLKPANRAAADIVIQEALRRVPRRTGKLAGTLRSGATRKAGVVRAGTKRVPYAGPIHWGWPQRHIKAQPYLIDAAKATEDKWALKYKEAVDQAIAEVRGM